MDDTLIKTKKVPCSYKDCGLRRKHFEDPYTPRGTRMIEVPDDHKGPMYCSIECACLDGAFSVRTGWIKKDKNE